MHGGMEAFDVLVELAELDRQGRHRTTPRSVPASHDGGRPASLTQAEIVAARALVREARELLQFSESPWESPFYRDPVGFVERLTAALERALPLAAAYLEGAADPSVAAVYDRAAVER